MSETNPEQISEEWTGTNSVDLYAMHKDPVDAFMFAYVLPQDQEDGRVLLNSIITAQRHAAVVEFAEKLLDENNPELEPCWKHSPDDQRMYHLNQFRNVIDQLLEETKE